MSTTVQDPQAEATDSREAQMRRALDAALEGCPRAPQAGADLRLIVGGYPMTRDYDYDGEVEGDTEL